jgi:hypothetical protein
MSYTKREFAEGLSEQMKMDGDVVRIARWAHGILMNHALEFEAGLKPVVLKVIAMEEGPEFELTDAELTSIVASLSQRPQ